MRKVHRAQHVDADLSELKEAREQLKKEAVKK